MGRGAEPRGRGQGRRAARAAAIVAELDAAHGQGLIHRDVKPANVLLSAEDGHALLADFGITTADLTVTADYAAPEQIEGRQLDARTDVYALGGVAFAILTGSVSYPRDGAVAKTSAHVNEPPPSARALRPELSDEIDDVLARAMAKDPAARFASAGEFAAALHAAVREPATMKFNAVAPPRGRRRMRVAVAGVAAALAAAIGVGAFAFAPAESEAPAVSPPNASGESQGK